MEENRNIDDLSTKHSSSHSTALPRIQPSLTNTNPCKITLDLFTYIKIGIIIVMIVFLACNTVFSFALPHGSPECLNDGLFNLTQSLNTYFIHNTIARRVLLIVCSLCIDGVFFASSIYWILVSRSWRFLFVLLLFYGTRALVQAVFQLGFPQGYNWVSPEFPSLVTNYASTNDFFYSGHVGMPLIAALEFNKMGLNISAMFCLLVSLLEGFMLIITRGHYSVDIFAGLIVAHYFFLIIDKYIHIVDGSIIGMKKREDELKSEQDENGYQKVNMIVDVESS